MAKTPLTIEEMKAAMGYPAAKLHPAGITLPEITLGSDPEFMVYDLQKDKMVSAIDVLQNDKYTPIDLSNGAKVYADNVLLEFSFPPVTTSQAFIHSIRNALRDIQKVLGNRYRLVAKAAYEYDAEAMANPKALEGGCSPNFDVYEGRPNKPPAFKDGFRTGSFHLHIGSPEFADRESKDRIIKLLDYYLGLASLVFDKDPSSVKRRALYGKAGEFRPTPYGVEYRVLGPYALRSPALVMVVLNLAAKAVTQFRAQVGSKKLKMMVSQEQVKTTINSGNPRDALSILSGTLSGILFRSISQPRAPDLYRDWRIMENTEEPDEDVSMGSNPYISTKPIRLAIDPDWATPEFHTTTDISSIHDE